MRQVSLLFTACVLALSLPAQEPEPVELPAEVYGGGVRPSMLYTSERNLSRQTRFEVGYEAAYDDNPLLSPTPERHDVVHTASGQALYARETARAALLLEYRPFYQFYDHYSSYNRFEQTAVVDGLWKLPSQWSLRVRDDFRDQTGSSYLVGSMGDGGAASSPTGLNQSLYAPFARERQNTARLDLVHALHPHASLDLFAAYDLRSFPESTAVLYGSILRSGGGELTWRLREHASVGVLGMGEQMNVQGKVPAQTPVRLRIGSLLPTLGWRHGPNLEVHVFAGPQWVKSYSGARGSTPPADWRWAAGGSLTDHTERAALLLTLEHALSDGGGLMTYVASTSGSAAWRRRIGEPWELRLDLGASRNDWYPSVAGRTRVTGETGSLAVARTLSRSLRVEVAYERTHQRSSEALLPAARFDRNRFSSGLVWTLERTAPNP